MTREYRHGMWVVYTDEDGVDSTGILVKSKFSQEGTSDSERWDVHLTNSKGETKAVVQGVDYNNSCKQADVEDIPEPRRNTSKLEKLGYKHKSIL